jgi:hypothetical protein
MNLYTPRRICDDQNAALLKNRVVVIPELSRLWKKDKKWKDAEKSRSKERAKQAKTMATNMQETE